MADAIANLSAVVTGAMHAAKAVATEVLPAAVTREAVVEATRASAAWFLGHLWAWLALARAVAVDNLPAGAAAAAWSAADTAVEASGPWVRTAAQLLRGLYGWLVAAAVEKLPAAAADKLLGDAAAWFVDGHGAAVYAALALTLLAVAFVGGGACALACRRAMRDPGLAGTRAVPEVSASPRRHRAAVRTARPASRGACSLLPAGLVVAFAAYLAAKVLNIY
ncbi:hypothetical protein ACP4OV_012358 [Aristida adscensionis]